MSLSDQITCKYNNPNNAQSNKFVEYWPLRPQLYTDKNDRTSESSAVANFFYLQCRPLVDNPSSSYEEN
jgi:hypothetical protein